MCRGVEVFEVAGEVYLVGEFKGIIIKEGIELVNIGHNIFDFTVINGFERVFFDEMFIEVVFVDF